MRLGSGIAGHTFETAIIGLNRRGESSIEEALIKIWPAFRCGGLKTSRKPPGSALTAFDGTKAGRLQEPVFLSDRMMT
jgi:hypothetical protein